MSKPLSPSYRYARKFGERLAASRRAAGYDTYTAFAIEIGVQPETYRTWEKGLRSPGFYHLAKISEALGKSLDFLILGKQPG